MTFLASGNDSAYTNISYQVEIASIVDSSTVNLYTRITESDNSNYPEGLVFGGYILQNPYPGVSIYAESPETHEFTNYYTTSLTCLLYTSPSPRD